MKTLLAILATCALPIAARAGEISNESLTVAYDPGSAEFSVKSNGKPFVTGGKLDGVFPGAQDKAGALVDPRFGSGRCLAIACENGGEARLALFPGQPFVFIQRTLANTTAREREIRSVSPASFTIDLGKPADKLVSMGTGGLLGLDRDPASYLFLTVADPSTRHGVVTGWLTHDRGDGVVFGSIDRDKRASVRGQIDYGRLRLASGASAALETMVVGWFADARIGQENFADAMKKHYAISLRPQVSAFCTWYSEVGGLTDPANGAGALNEKDIVRLADTAANQLKPYGLSVIQIDDEWQDGATNPDGSRINGPRRGFLRHKPDGPYPSGMAHTAKNLNTRGFTAGIWFLPFAGNHQDPRFPKEWFMQRRDGMPYETTWGGTSFDLTNPAVQDHLRKLATTLKGWGYNYFKMDGMWTGSCAEQVYVNDGYTDDSFGNNKPFHDKNATNIEALRTGLRILREAAGPDVFFSGCCASQNMRSLGGLIGMVDSMRIGPDNGFGWQDWRNETMHFEGGGIITGPIRANRLYFLHGRVWWNDPDPTYVRPAVKPEHARLLSSWIALSGQFNLIADWLPGLPPDRLDMLKRCMPAHSLQARPVDYFDNMMPAIWLVTDARDPAARRDVLGLYNWDSEDATLGYNCAKAGLEAGKPYHAFDYWAAKPLAMFKDEFAFDLAPESCRVIAVRAAAGHPVVVSTSRHVTQGAVDLQAESWRDNTLAATSAIIANDSYEVRIAGLNDGGRWQAGEIKLADADAAAGATIKQVAAEDGWLRLQISSPVSRAVHWSVGFTK